MTFSTNVNLPNGAETVVATLTGVRTLSPSEQVRVEADALVTLGANTTGYTLRIRRGATVDDTLVGEANVEQIEVAAGSTESVRIVEVDAPGGELGNGTYVLTFEPAAATAAATALEGSMSAATV
jgi:hypothetical protein